jgi:sulfur-carrier protein adenylyltransferase/sulfurtransferase
MEKKRTDIRYQRQVTLKGFGEAAQNALLQAKVFVAGAGGLGCPVLQYLTAAGVGCIGIADGDVVSLSNLHRQVLYDTGDTGKSKCTKAAAKLRLMNPGTVFIEYNSYLDNSNCMTIIDDYEIVIDCTDNFAARYMLNDACVLKGKPLVYAAVNRFEGQVAVFNASGEGEKRSANYRDLFPRQPAQGEVLNCAEAGVLGVLPGIIGSMQANEVIKLITGIGEPLINQLLTYNALINHLSVFKYEGNALSAAMIPEDEAAFKKMDYAEACAVEDNDFGISIEKFDELLAGKKVRIIDVRELHELPLITAFETTSIPLGELKNKLDGFSGTDIVFICQSGSRSLRAAATAADYFENKDRFYSVNGGIIAWEAKHQKQVT